MTDHDIMAEVNRLVRHARKRHVDALLSELQAMSADAREDFTYHLHESRSSDYVSGHPLREDFTIHLDNEARYARFGIDTGGGYRRPGAGTGASQGRPGRLVAGRRGV